MELLLFFTKHLCTTDVRKTFQLKFKEKCLSVESFRKSDKYINCSEMNIIKYYDADSEC